MRVAASPAAHGARRLLRRLGVDVVRYTPDRFVHLRRSAILRDHGISVVLDAGANTGQWAEKLRREGWHGRLMSFEPLGSAFATLLRSAADDPFWECRCIALADVDGEATLNVSQNELSNSLLAITERHVQGAPSAAYSRTEMVTTARLDSLAPDVVGDDDRAYLKLDVQGYELPVIDGAQETLPRIEAIEAELSLVPLYEGQAIYLDIIERLDRAGYGLASLEPGYVDAGTGELLQLDAIFVRRYRTEARG